MGILHVLSLFVCVLIFIGIYYRKRIKIHTKIMTCAFIIDISMVLYIELTRKAVATAMKPPHLFVAFHILISVIVLFLYFFQIGTGVLRMKNKDVSKFWHWHKYCGASFVGFRILNFITSVWIESFMKH